MTELAKKVTCVALHAADGDGHEIVGIGNLRVVLIPEDDKWFAQALEIDYLAEGKDIEEAKQNFQKGLKATITLNLQVSGTIEKMLRTAPPEVWQETAVYPGAKFRRYSQISMHDLLHEDATEIALPFVNLDYLIAADSKQPLGV